MKITIDNKIYEGTPEQIVSEMAMRDHETSNPILYMEKVKERHGSQFPHDLIKSEHGDYNGFLHELERTGYVKIVK